MEMKLEVERKKGSLTRNAFLGLIKKNCMLLLNLFAVILLFSYLGLTAHILRNVILT